MKKTVLLFVLGSFAFAGSAQTQVNSSTKALNNPSRDGTFPKPGEWPSFRRNGTLQAHSPLRGNIAKPAIIWKQFVGAMESLVVVEPGERNTKLNLPGEETEPRVPADSITMADFIPVPKNEEEDNSSRNYT